MINFLKGAPAGLKTFDELFRYATNLYKQTKGVFPEGIDKISIQRQAANLAEERGKVIDLPTSNIKNLEKTGPTVDLSKYTNEDLNKLVKEGDELQADLSLMDEEGASTLPYREFQEKSARLKEINDIIRAAQESKLPDSYFDRPRGEGGIPTTIEGKTKNMSAEEIMDFLMNKGKGKDTNIGTAPKTTKKKPTVDPELKAMDDQNEMFKDFSKRVKDMSPTDRVAERLRDLKGVELSELSGIEAQKIASELIGRKGPFKTISNKGAKEVLGELEGVINKANAEPDLGTKLKDFDGDPDAMAQGGRIGFSGGGAGFAGNQMEGVLPEQEPMGPVFETNDPRKAAKEIMTRMAGSSGLVNIPVGGGFGFGVGFGSQRNMDVGFGFNPQNPNFDFSGGLGTLDGKPSVGFQFRKQFKDGSKPPSKSRRNFLKLMAGLGSLPFVGPLFKGAKTVNKVTEAAPVVAEGAKLGFDNFMLLVDKIKRLGKDVSKKNATQEREKVTRYQTNDNEYELIEDLSTGDIRIVKDRMGGVTYGDEAAEVINDRSVLDYKSPQSFYNNQKKKGGKTPAEYEEVKEVANRDGTFDDFDEIDDFAVQEMLEEIGKTSSKSPREILDKRIQEIVKQRNKKAGGGVAYMLGE
jgi:hypothetical protein